jgi:hypothetical protein
MRTSFHHQPEAQHPKSSAIHKLPADYPIYGVEIGHHRLVMSISAFDPKRTCVVAFCCDAWPDHCLDIPYQQPGIKHRQAKWTLSSASRITLEATTPTVTRASARRLAVGGEMSCCSKTILRPQATWVIIAIGPTQ